MPVLAAIDVGSNAMRCVVASIDAERRVEILENLREPVRLGQDVFTRGVIAEGTMNRAADAFRRFAEAIRTRGAIWTKALATSATREALNKEIFIDRILQSSGIELATIGSEEEARLIHLAVMQRINLKNKLALLVDIGGGSTEITIASGESVLSTESYKMGSVRLLQLLEESRHDAEEFTTLVEEYVDATRRRIIREIGDRTIDLCIGTGGNLETLGDLRRQVLGKERDTVLALAELESLLDTLRSLSFEERIARVGLRPDRADVIVPAAIIIRRIMRQAGTEMLQIPRVGLKDGILADMIQELYGEKRGMDREQVLASAMALGRKYAFDEQHGLAVARFALELFDQTKPLHNLALEHRVMLEVAAVLHDIGTFVNVTGHHKHTQYLLLASPLVGLSREQMAIVGNVARYHRKSFPKPQHDAYRVLSGRDRVVVSKLAALLRLADAMDNEHATKVESFTVDLAPSELTLHLKGKEDLLLEKWALMQKAPMFEEVYSVRVRIGE